LVIGSAILNALEAAGMDVTMEQKAEAVWEKIAHLCTGLNQAPDAKNQAMKLGTIPEAFDKEEQKKQTYLPHFS
jgi:hypothetical protein